MEDTLALIYNIILALTVFAFFIVIIVKETVNRRQRIVSVLYLINTLIMLPCAYVTCVNIGYKLTGLYFWPWTRSFLGFILPVVLLRCFYLPYVTTAVLTGLCIYMIKKYKSPKKTIIAFAIMILLNVLGIISLEEVFAAAMSV